MYHAIYDQSDERYFIISLRKDPVSQILMWRETGIS